MPGFHFPNLKIVEPIEKVVLFLKGGDRDEVYPLGQIPSTPEMIRRERQK